MEKCRKIRLAESFVWEAQHFNTIFVVVSFRQMTNPLMFSFRVTGRKQSLADLVRVCRQLHCSLTAFVLQQDADVSASARDTPPMDQQRIVAWDAQAR